MKRKFSGFLAIIMAMQLLLSGIVTVSAEEAGSAYTAPESPSVTYNMNLDWKYFLTKTGTKSDIWMALAEADKDGKKFYEKDYDDSDWETVSIPHAPGGGTNSFTGAITDAGGGFRGVLLYRKTFTVPASAKGGKVFFELDGIRQCAYVWVNGKEVGYYEAGITAMGFDITNFVTAGEEAVIAICNDGTTGRGTSERIPYETVPGQTRQEAYTKAVEEIEEGIKDGRWSGSDLRTVQSDLATYQGLLDTMTDEERNDTWGTSYTPNNYKSTVGSGAHFQWNMKDFNEPQIGLVYDAYLHIKGGVYQTLPLYNNLKTTGNYIYASDFNIRENKATINVKSEVRNETGVAGDYTLEVAVVDHEGNLKYNFESSSVTVSAAADAGVVYETAVEKNAYEVEAIGATKVNTPDVTYIDASYAADDVRFWSTEDPYLYTVYTILKDNNGNAVDVQSEKTGFRKVTYDPNNGVMLNDRGVWLRGYAQRSTNEWAVIGVAPDWLQDYDMKLLKDNNSNFIRWMHVAPKAAEVRSADKYGVAIVCPAGDDEASVNGRQWSQRTEAMRDAMIYFRNSPSILFWETGNSAVGSADKANEMTKLRDSIDPHGMRFIGARSTRSAAEINYDYNYAGTMYGNYASEAINAMKSNSKMGPIMETEYARDESPRRVWDRYSPPDYDYVNKALSAVNGGEHKKEDGFDYWDLTQEEITVNNVREYNGYYANRAGNGNSVYSAAAMMVWSDSIMHGRNSGSENCRTSGRVDPVRQTKEMFEGTKTAQSDEADVHIIGHWSYPEVSDDTYNYYASAQTGVTGKVQNYTEYDTNKVLKRDPTKKTVYVIGSPDVAKVELYRIDGEAETLLGTDSSADSSFIYQFNDIDVTKGDAVIAKGYDARGAEVTNHKIERTYDAKALKLEANISPAGWRADGSDIAYVDVKVVDENGNVCVLNYDRIDFTYSGNGVYMGGYNSGMGAGCFQNEAASTGISKYFGGAKDGVPTLGKDYVYAENGTNRIFIRSTRNAGAFTLTASMDGMLPASVTITSQAVETDGGLTTVMQSTMEPGVSAPVVSTTVQALKPLMLTKLAVNWANVVKVSDDDGVDYYDTYVNGTKLDVEQKTRVGIMNTLFGPIYPVLLAIRDAGVTDFTVEYDGEAEVPVLTVVKNGTTYQYYAYTNAIFIDGVNTTEIVDAPAIEDGVMIANLGVMLEIVGAGISVDEENKICNITTAQ